MQDQEETEINENMARTRKELVLMAELYFAHDLTEKAREVMLLIHDIDKHTRSGFPKMHE